MTTLALLGDTMLGRGVAQALATTPPEDLVSPEVRELAATADLTVLNLECCISDRGEPWPDPRKPFFFRAPPAAVGALQALGVDAVTLANNHALDFGEVALLDTLHHLADAGIAVVGAGPDREPARAPAVIAADGLRVGVVGLTDHPEDFAAGDGPGVAYADLRRDTPAWVDEAIAAVDADVVLVTPHWGPNMTDHPVPHVRRCADELVAAGADVVAGHSAHVFHGVTTRQHGRDAVPVLFDLGDFLDDYAVDPLLRNDLGLFWFVVFDGAQPSRVEAVPLALDFCRTRLAEREERAWIADRFTRACAAMGQQVERRDGRLVVDLRSAGEAGD